MLTGARLLPFVDDFAIFASNFEETLQRKEETFSLIRKLGLQIHETKGYHTPTLIGEHLGMILDFDKGEFRAPPAKLKSIASLATTILCRGATQKRWATVKSLASLVRKA